MSKNMTMGDAVLALLHAYESGNVKKVKVNIDLDLVVSDLEKLQLENNALKEQLKLAESQIDDLKQQVDELNKAVYQENGED